MFNMHARLLTAKFYQFMRTLPASQAAIATFMELTCLASEIGKIYIVIALVLLQTRELLIMQS